MNGGSLRLPGRALVSPRGRGATRDPPIPGASRRRRPSPAPRPGSPPGHRGPCWKLSFPCRWRTHGWNTHPGTTHGEGSRGLSQPLGIHLNFALGLSNEVRPPQAKQLVYGHLRDHFHGKPHCEGCASIKSSADGQQGLGSPEVWRRIGTVHHITEVTQSLRSLPVS